MASSVLEIEQKYRTADLDGVRSRVLALGARYVRTEQHADEYFAHPCRDLRSTDEALRIRRRDGFRQLTYKGPRRERRTKIREEIECDLSLTHEESLVQILHHLGFRTIRVVAKTRQVFEWTADSFSVQLGLDTVPELGDFVELEILTDAQNVPKAKTVLESLALRLELHELVEPSYLGMLLAADAARQALP